MFDDAELISRKDVLRASVLGMAGLALPVAGAQIPTSSKRITLDDLKACEKIAGVEFSDEERKALLNSIQGQLGAAESLRKIPVDYRDEPSTVFSPIGRPRLASAAVRVSVSAGKISKPKTDSDLAFATIPELAGFLRSGQVSSVELTKFFLSRLKKFDEKLNCVITLTEKLALLEAERADRDFARGVDRGLLQGIPYGLKDLFAVKNYPTTWGAGPFEGQILDHNSTVYQRLSAAGAVLCAKLSMGALAMNDVWFKARTNNPHNLAQGSSGSSAGSASAVAAGLVPFAIGTETLGSIMSPSARCRVSGLRPTYGRVSRYGAMGLSYTMDKIGPIARNFEDAAIIFSTICGVDPNDSSSTAAPFDFSPKRSIKGMRIGWLTPGDGPPTDLDLKGFLLKQGAIVAPVKFTAAPSAVLGLLSVEAGSAFDDFTTGGEVRKLKNSSWPGTFRGSRYVSAVDYLRQQRIRSQVMRRFEDELGTLDAVINGFDGNLLRMTNLTGHPQVHLPAGGGKSITIVGRLYRDDRLLELAWAIQRAFPKTLERPEGFA